MFHAVMSSSTSLSDDATVYTNNKVQDFGALNLNPMANKSITMSSQLHQPPLPLPPPPPPLKIKKKRNLPGHPDPDAEVIALSPKSLLATNRFLCEICNKGFQRDQNLQLHRRGHNLPWKLKQRNNKENSKKRAYVCPEPTCVHHHPSRALGDLTGIKKHFCRKHGEKKWKCEKCSKIYAVQSDWKAHSKTCGTREYRCDCGTLFSRKDSFITHRAFCDALAEESARLSASALFSSAANQSSNGDNNNNNNNDDDDDNNNSNITHNFNLLHQQNHNHAHSSLFSFSPSHHPPTPLSSHNHWDPPKHVHSPNHHHSVIKPENIHLPVSSPFFHEPAPAATAGPFQCLHVSTQSTTYTCTSASLSATALLQKAATVGAHAAGQVHSAMTKLDVGELGMMAPEYVNFRPGSLPGTWQKRDRLTRDFLGLTAGINNNGSVNVDVNVSMNVRNLISFTEGVVEFPTYDRDHSQGFGFAEPPASETWGNC